MKLVYVSHHRKYRTRFRPGMFASHLAKRGHEVTLVCIRDKGKFQLKESFEDGVRYLETPDLLWGKMRSGWDPWGTVRRFPLLSKIIENADLVHAFETRPATIHPIQWAFRKYRVPLCMDWIDWWGRGGLISELRPRWYQFFFEDMETYYEESFRTMAESLTVISSALKQRAIELGVAPDRIFKVIGGAETDFFIPQNEKKYREKFVLPLNKRILGFSAQDVTMDTELVFQTLQKISRKCPDVLLIMTGHKPRNLSTLVDRYEVNDHFKHLGFLAYEELPQALACAEIFLLPFPDKPANRGRWPNKICNYMCLARPTVTNRVGEMRVLFQEEEIGFAVDSQADAMSEATIKLLDDKVLCKRFGENARKVAEQRFAWNHIIDKQLLPCYEEAIRRFNR